MPASGRSKSADRIVSASSLRQALSLRRAWLRLQEVGSANLKSMSSDIRWISEAEAQRFFDGATLGG
jgi:hypothetical protein